MVTRASTRKDSPAKSGAKPEPAAQKSAARKTTTDLISPKTKKPATEDKPGRNGVPPIRNAGSRTRHWWQSGSSEASDHCARIGAADWPETVSGDQRPDGDEHFCGDQSHD